MAKVMINIRNEDANNFQNNDLLVYDAINKEFYRTTAEDFFSLYEEKLKDLLNKYDAIVAELKKENKDIKKDYLQMKAEMQVFANNLTESQKNTINKLTNMVENFINTGGK